jgi:hypothetical protein
VIVPRRVSLWILGFVVLILLFFTGLFDVWTIELVFHLTLGWIGHLIAVLPKVTFNWSAIGFLLVCVALAGFIGHRFCRWLWQGSGHPDPWRLRWTLSGFAILILMFGAGMTITAVAHQTGWLIGSPERLLSSGGASNERNASASLKTVATAQADFRANDRDWNQINDFWRGDIAGLYTVKGMDGQPIKLIELSVGSADDRPVTDMSRFSIRSPKAGYWFRALRYKDEAEKVDAESRFAACAFPSSVGAGVYMFLVTQDNTIYRKIFEGQPPELCPDEPLKDGWSKLD